MPSSLLHRPRARTLAAAAAAAALAAPLAGCGNDKSASAGGGSAGADPAAFVPASSAIYLEAQVRPGGDLKANVEAVASKILRTSDPGQKVVALIDKGLKDDGQSYAQDVQPWLGRRAGLAVTGVAGGGRNPDIAVAIASKDDGAAEKFLSSRKGATQRTYQGVTYRYKAGDDLAAAVVDHAVVLGTERGFKSAIDAHKGTPLNEGGDFKQARQTVGTAGLGFLYADPARFFDLAAGAAVQSTRGQATQQQLNAAKGLLTGSGLRSIAASLDVQQDALRIDAAALGVKPGSALAGRGDAAAAAADVPAGSWLSVGIGDVGGTVQGLLKSVGASGATGGMDPQILLDQLKASLGFDVRQDLLSWMGDGALFVRGTSMAQLEGALVVHSKDPAASQAAIGKLKGLLAKIGQDVGPLRDAPSGATGFTVRTRGLPQGLQVASKDDTFVLAIGAGALGDALGGGDRLGDSAPFKTAAGLLEGAKPSLFLDTPQVVKLLDGLVGKDADFQKAKPTLQAFGPAAAGVKADGDVTRLKAAVAVP